MLKGLNKKKRRKDLKDQITKWVPSIAILVETKVKSNKEGRVKGCIPSCWEMIQ